MKPRPWSSSDGPLSRPYSTRGCFRPLPMSLLPSSGWRRSGGSAVCDHGPSEAIAEALSHRRRFSAAATPNNAKPRNQTLNPLDRHRKRGLPTFGLRQAQDLLSIVLGARAVA